MPRGSAAPKPPVEGKSEVKDPVTKEPPVTPETNPQPPLEVKTAPLEVPAKEVPPTDIPVAAKEKPKDKDKDKTPKDPKDPKYTEPKEPTEIGGKSFAYWQQTLQKNKDPGKREEAIKAILLFGPNKAYEAVPDLLSELNKHFKTPRDLSVRVHSVSALTTIFRNKDKVDPKHVEAAFAVFKRYLTDPQVIMKITAVQSIPFLGPVSRGALDEVITMTKDTSTWEVRKAAVQTLAMLATPDGKGAGPNAKGMAAIKAVLDRELDGEPKEISRFVARPRCNRSPCSVTAPAKCPSNCAPRR